MYFCLSPTHPRPHPWTTFLPHILLRISTSNNGISIFLFHSSQHYWKFTKPNTQHRLSGLSGLGQTSFCIWHFKFSSFFYVVCVWFYLDAKVLADQKHTNVRHKVHRRFYCNDGKKKTLNFAQNHSVHSYSNFFFFINNQ